MHRLATVHARDNQRPTNQRRHDTAYLNKRLFYYSKVRRLKTADGFACQSDRSRSLDKDVGYNSVAGSDIPSVMASLSSVTYICLRSHILRLICYK